MSDTERSKQADDATAVRPNDGAQASADTTAEPAAESTAEPAREAASRPRLADRLMGRTGPKAGGSTATAHSTNEASTQPNTDGRTPSSPARPTNSESDIQPTGSAASAVPAPPGARRDGNNGTDTDPANTDQTDADQTNADQTNVDLANASTALSAGPVVGTGRPDFAAGVPTTVSTAPRENHQVGVVDPKDLSATSENAGSSTEAGDKTSSNREILTKGRPSTRRTRKARLRLASVDPWSVMKMAFLFSMAAGIALVVAVMVIWFIIGQSGLFDAVNQAVNDALSAPGDQNSFDLSRFVSGGRVIGSAMVLAVIDVLLLTALSTVGAFLYNLGATLLGGFEVTLADD